MIDRSGFTLMEIMIAIVIVGVVAAFAVPNYVKANNRAEERQMITNLRAIAAAQEIYKAQNGNYWPAHVVVPPTANQGIAAINAALKLSILTSGAKYTYTCNSQATQTYRCYASFSPGAFAWQLYTSNTISQGTAYANQVCCDSAFNPANPCPTVVWCP